MRYEYVCVRGLFGFQKNNFKKNAEKICILK